jgi:hypothetical protein
VNGDEVVIVLDWGAGRLSAENREMVGYARAHGFLVEAGGPPQSLVVTRDKLYLTKVTAATLRKRLETNIVSPPSEGMLR